mmetsp:Transcript_19773/g.30515  ORF Transcript_19773/g.30515 Transcript_19773/m.30515 type:complete len:618 (-) Transcript_19773:1880-3733(-)
MQKDPNDPQYNSGSEQELVRPPRDPRSLTPVYSEEGRPENTLNLDDSRSLSSHHCPSDSGYHSSGALSDGLNTVQMQTYEQGYHTTSSMRSVGSVGSQGSTERETRLHTTSSIRSVGSIGSQGSSSAFHRGPPGRVMIAAHLVSGETRFPTAMSYSTAEAPKSDIATVCSGSVIEDIEVSSVMSGGSNPPQTPNIPMQSSDRMVAGGARRTSSGGVGQAQQRVVDFAPQPHAPGFAAARPQYTYPPIRSSPPRSSPPLPPATAPVGASAIAMMNDMGPPLSRTLLLQDPPMASQGDSSRAGSVRSFGSTAGASSDVVAHVDTDDCGGSLVESVNDENSVKSQESNRSGADDNEVAKATDKSDLDDPPSGSGDSPTHPLLQDDTPSTRTNCRTSPGGTVYKGRGTRRYQGRYMHLPLKRFHQNGVTMEEETGREPGEPPNGCYSEPPNGLYADPPNGLYTEPQNGRYPEPKNGCYNNDYDGRAYGHAGRDWTRQRSRSRSPPPNERRNGNYRNRKRSWSRSRSQSRSRSCSPPVHTPQDNRSPAPDRTRSGRKSSRHKKRSSPTRHKSHRTRGERHPRSNGRSNRSESPSNVRSSSRSHQRYNRKKNGNSHSRRNSRV